MGISLLNSIQFYKRINDNESSRCYVLTAYYLLGIDLKASDVLLPHSIRGKHCYTFVEEGTEKVKWP